MLYKASLGLEGLVAPVLLIQIAATCRFSGAPLDNHPEPGLNLQEGGQHDESNHAMPLV